MPIQLRCINNAPFSGNKVAPPLEVGKVYPLVKIYIEDHSKGPFKHYDVGLESNYNYITSQDTGAELPNGDVIHWCHPSRFEEVPE